VDWDVIVCVLVNKDRLNKIKKEMGGENRVLKFEQFKIDQNQVLMP